MRSTCKIKRCDVVLLTPYSMNFGVCFYHRNQRIIDTVRIKEKNDELTKIKHNLSPQLYSLFIKEQVRK